MSDKSIVIGGEQKKPKTCLKGHSHLWDSADLDTTFASLKSVYLHPKKNVRVALQSCLVFHSILDLLQKTSLFGFQNNMNRRRDKRVGAGRAKSPSLTKITKEMNQ